MSGAETKPVPTFAFHFNGWKRPFLEAAFPGRRFHYLPFFLSDECFRKDWAPRVAASDNPEFFVWSLNLPEAARSFARDSGIAVHFMEDGFLRSLRSSAGYSVPFSLILDRQTPYFDSHGPSDLEDLLNSHDFSDDEELMTRARAGIDALLNSRISKYNAPVPVVAEDRPPARSRILVVGQVEEDASIRFGCDRPFTNNDLVRLAAAENPDCEIVYKPHPDVLNGVRRRLSDPAEVAHLCTIVTWPQPLPDTLDQSDHVYTITSLAGFEALLRGIPVTTIGCPFYSGWGLTDDRQPNPRRRRTLTIEALFAGAYLLYPRYFDPLTGAASTFEESLARMAAWREGGVPADADRLLGIKGERLPWRAFGPYGLLGWRHLLTPLVALVIGRIGNAEDVSYFRRDPIGFFRELSNPRLRRLGRLLYPFGD